MKKALFSALFATATLFSFHTLACTDFRLTAKDGTVMITRTLEFAMDLKSQLCSSNRDRVFTTTAPDGKPGITWTGKYGYIFLNALDNDITMDGMNEKGLSFEALLLPNYAQYQTVPEGHDNQALPYDELGDWILSNFQTVDEVKAAIPSIYLFATKMANAGDMIFPLHYAVYDKSGKGIVIEYVKGKLHVYDNSIGVMTNAPTYDWQTTNLTNYTQLKPTNPNPVTVNGVTYVATGQGVGMLGLPGDISPPSRFVKISVLVGAVEPAQNATEALNLAEHIINNVDIPAGLAREPGNDNYTNETTEWTVFKDLTHNIFYYRTYGDLTLHAVDMSKIDFSPKAKRLKISIISPEYIKNMTDEFLKSNG